MATEIREVAGRSGPELAKVRARFGPELAKVRAQHFDTQAAAADALGLRPTSVWSWEKGETLPSLARLASFAAVAGIVLTLVIAGDGRIVIETAPDTQKSKKGRKAP